MLKEVSVTAPTTRCCTRTPFYSFFFLLEKICISSHSHSSFLNKPHSQITQRCPLLPVFFGNSTSECVCAAVLPVLAEHLREMVFRHFPFKKHNTVAAQPYIWLKKKTTAGFNILVCLAFLFLFSPPGCQRNAC